MTPASKMGSDQSHFYISFTVKGTVSINHSFWRERTAEAESKRGSSPYQPNALPQGQTGSALSVRSFNLFNAEMSPERYWRGPRSGGEGVGGVEGKLWLHNNVTLSPPQWHFCIKIICSDESHMLMLCYLWGGKSHSVHKPQLLKTDSTQFSSFQFKMVFMRSEKPIIMLSTRSLRSFPNVAFETVPMFVWLTKALSRPFKEDRLALIPRWCDVLGFAPAGNVSSFSTLQIFREARRLWWLLCPPVYLLGHFSSLRYVQGSTPTRELISAG